MVAELLVRGNNLEPTWVVAHMRKMPDHVALCRVAKQEGAEGWLWQTLVCWVKS